MPPVAHFIQDFLPSMTNWLPFYWQNYKQTVRYTYIIRVENLEAVYKNFNKSVRRNISKAEKILLPGVGAFDAAMKRINEVGLLEVLNKKAFWGT